MSRSSAARTRAAVEGPKARALGEPHAALELGPEVERRRIVRRALGRQEVADEAQRELARAQPHRLLDVAVDDVVLPGGQPVARASCRR